MKGTLLVVSLTVILGIAGFSGSTAVCTSIQESRPGASQRSNARRIGDAAERVKYSLIGGSIGAGVGFVLGIIMIAIIERRRESPSDQSQEADVG